MVRAILDGRKTQTRREVKPQPPCNCSYHINGWESHALCHATENYFQWVPPTPKSKDHRLPCPYGRPGNHLWVRETFWNRAEDGLHLYAATGELVFHKDSGAHRMGIKSVPHDVCSDEDKRKHGFVKRPSIFMPRWASRITLVIEAVRVERLQDIGHRDALSEGVSYDVSKPDGSPMAQYKKLWDSINGPGSWSKNPWVWVITFKRIAP